MTQQTNQPAQTEQWTTLCHVDELPATDGHYVEHGNRMFAVFRRGESVCVINDTCPHAGASLSAGFVDDECVVCPWHGWTFNIESGELVENPDIKVRRYPVRIVDGNVQVQLQPA